jgi:hypothetical protein
MLEDLKLIIKANKKELPVISHYWEMEIVDNKKGNEYSNTVVSIDHNTSQYLPYRIYKPISTSVDFSYYEQKELL